MNRKFFKNIGIDPDIILFFPRIKATLYEKPDNFIVEEIQENGEVIYPKREKSSLKFNDKKRYLHAILVKKNISTFDACREIAVKNNLDPSKDISFYGLKDTNALTTQKICIKNKKNLKLNNFSKFYLKNYKPSNIKLKINKHKGNRFIIKAKIKSLKEETIIKCLNKFITLIQNGLPNFYGPQRFGIRQNNHKLGKLLINEEYDKFIFNFLTYTNNNECWKNRIIRRKIKNNYNNWDKCLRILNNNDNFNDEKELISNLKNNKNRLIAIKRMRLANFFIYSYMSYLFNLALSLYLKKQVGKYRDIKIEQLGRTSRFNKFHSNLYGPILMKEKISLRIIKKACQIFSVKEHLRNTLFTPRNFIFILHKKILTLQFDLGKGQYASLVLDFLIDNQGRFKEKLN